MVKINSGEFPLMRNIDMSHQPSRSKVYAAWLRAFEDMVPDAINHLADVIEDVYTYELWRERRLDTPEAFLENFGIFGLDLENPAKLIKELRNKKSPKRREMEARQKAAKELREQGMTQQQIADRLGVNQRTVSSDLEEKSVMTQKVSKEPRRRGVYQISQYTKPSTAAAKIREKFGDAFAADLAAEIMSDLRENGGKMQG